MSTTPRVLFVNGPSQDPSDRFFGWPTSLLYAIAPSCQSARSGEMEYEILGKLFEPIWFVEELNGASVRSGFLEAAADAQVICASVTYDSLYPTLQLFEEAKRRNPDALMVLGGPHVDEVHARCDLRADCLGCADYMVAGDGEYALKALLQAIARGQVDAAGFEDVEGRFWVYGSRGLVASGATPLQLDRLPTMPLEHCDLERHGHDFDLFYDGSVPLPTCQMIARRGCSYHCAFCSERADLAPPNVRSIPNVVAEVEERHALGFRAVFFDDSTFGQYPRLRSLLAELSRTGMRFGCLNRFNHLTDPRLLEAYREAGFEYFYCSIEQFEDTALTALRKDQSTSAITTAMTRLHGFGFRLGVSLLYGLPTESEESIRATLDFVGKWVDMGTIELVSQSVLTVHPGTPLGRGSAGTFNRRAPNRGYPFDRFEEGQWDHLPHVTADYLERVDDAAERIFGRALVRHRHSWSARRGLLRNSCPAARAVREESLHASPP